VQAREHRTADLFLMIKNLQGGMNMLQRKRVLSLRQLMILSALTCALTFVAGCVAPFSDLQSAKLLGRGNVEVTPSYTSVSATSEGETQHIQNHYGVQAGYGLFGFMDLRLRYERIDLNADEDSIGVNVFGFGPKFRLFKNWLALYVPVGFAFGSDVQTSESWQVHPTLLATLPIGKSLEINPSAKVMIPFQGDYSTLYAFNLGLAISTDVSKWALRPEIGICTDFSGGHFMQLSIGFTVSSGLFKK
jgi:hypothetical protein